MKTGLASAPARRLILCLGVALVIPSVGARLVLDDHLQSVMRMKVSPVAGIPHAPLDLFSFARPGTLNDTLMSRGMLLPWWTDRALRIAFFRPLASLTHVLDGYLWPDSPRWMYVHGLVWYAGLLAAVSTVYRRLLRPPWLANLALLLYAVDDTHGATVSWIANRNAIVASLFGMLTLLAHDHWRRGNQPRRAWLAASVFVLALLAGEMALGACAYLGAYALFVDRASRRSRLMSVLPYFGLVIAWRIGYQALGYGASGSGLYLDPGREPLAFLGRLPTAFALLMQGQFGLFSADLWLWSPPEDAPLLVGAGLATCGLVGLLLFPLLRHDREARFWTASLVGSLIPCASSIPGDRLLLLPGVAAMALLARLFSVFAERLPPLPVRGAWRTVVALPLLALFVRRVVFASLLLPLRAHSMDVVGQVADVGADAVPAAAEVAGQTLVVVNPPASLLASYVGLTLATRRAPIPRHVRWLATASSEITLTRLSAHVLRVHPRGGFLESRPDLLYRSSGHGLRIGDRIAFDDVTAVVVSLTSAGTPADVDFQFIEPLESPRYIWRRWEGNTCVPYRPPAIGERAVLPPITFLNLITAAALTPLSHHPLAR